MDTTYYFQLKNVKNLQEVGEKPLTEVFDLIPPLLGPTKSAGFPQLLQGCEFLILGDPANFDIGADTQVLWGGWLSAVASTLIEIEDEAKPFWVSGPKENDTRARAACFERCLAISATFPSL